MWHWRLFKSNTGTKDLATLYLKKVMNKTNQACNYSPAASLRRVALVAFVEEEVDCIEVAAVEEALMVGLYSYPVVACLEALADSLEAFAVVEAFAAVEVAY